MNHVITFTAYELWAMVLAICGGIVAISGAITVLAKLAIKIKEPETNQNERIKACEDHLESIDGTLKEYKGYFQRDKMRLDRLEFGNEAENRALLALLNHAIHGDNTDELKSAKKELEQYLLANQRPVEP